MPARRILGGGRTTIWSFPNSSGWWWLIRSVFLTEDLLSQNNSCRWLLWCLARVSGFSQYASPNKRKYWNLRDLWFPHRFTSVAAVILYVCVCVCVWLCSLIHMITINASMWQASCWTPGIQRWLRYSSCLQGAFSFDWRNRQRWVSYMT